MHKQLYAINGVKSETSNLNRRFHSKKFVRVRREVVPVDRFIPLIRYLGSVDFKKGEVA